MQTLENYLTVKGWEKDLLDTKEDFSNLFKSNHLTNIIKNEQGNTSLATLGFVASMPVCAYIGSYIGEGMGWVGGNIIDFIPYIRDVAPWLAERTGLVHDTKNIANFNVDLYQTTGAIGGFWAGLFLPINILLRSYK